MNLLKLDKITLTIKDHTILDQANLLINSGDFICIKGSSGVGKTTLLYALNKMKFISDGEIIYKDKNIININGPELRKKIVLIPQKPVMLPGSIYYNLTFHLNFSVNRFDLKTENIVDDWLKEFNLSNIDLLMPAENLSLGQQQRVSIIRGLLLNPEILILDEPTSSLDRENKINVEKILQRENQINNLTCVVVDHHGLTTKHKQIRNIVLKNSSLIEDLS